jgi:hypothetical protein
MMVPPCSDKGQASEHASFCVQPEVEHDTFGSNCFGPCEIADDEGGLSTWPIRQPDGSLWIVVDGPGFDFELTPAAAIALQRALLASTELAVSGG